MGIKYQMLFVASVSFSVCFVLMPLGMVLAKRVGLVDKPSARKRHLAPTPLVGGIVIFLALVLSNFYFNEISWSFLGWMALVLLIGVLDDIFDVSYKIRLASQAAIVLGIFLTDGLLVNEIGSLFGGDTVDFFGPVALLFTAVGVIGAINATNMVDGVDGLLSSLTLASLIALIVFLQMQGEVQSWISPGFLAMLFGSVAAFFVFNSRFFIQRTAYVFMGDAGSTMLGFFVVYALIAFSQGESSIFSPVLAGWILGIPLLDASAVIASRLIDGKAPFFPDRRHLHHLLLDTGKSVNQTVLIILGAHCVLLVVGSFSFMVYGSKADPYLFWGFVSLVIVRVAAGSLFLQSIEQGDNHRTQKSVPKTSITTGVGLSEPSELRANTDIEKAKRSSAVQ